MLFSNTWATNKISNILEKGRFPFTKAEAALYHLSTVTDLLIKQGPLVGLAPPRSMGK